MLIGYMRFSKKYVLKNLLRIRFGDNRLGIGERKNLTRRRKRRREGDNKKGSQGVSPWFDSIHKIDEAEL